MIAAYCRVSMIAAGVSATVATTRGQSFASRSLLLRRFPRAYGSISQQKHR
ncbi:unnamed protein product [Symbiodinium natans]|uniref:Uncharacterized protein n=1 Tax=Symbiodinium natans TaxID=878477 RepID=A0A812KZ89_9DINO|nr:unnamed protein product [Symbiodinium natans]